MMKKSEVKSQKPKARSQKIEARHKIMILSVFCLLFAVFLGIADAKEAIKDSGVYQITDIEVLDNAVKIKVNGHIRYKTSNPDPFRVIVDIEGVSLGKFNDKIYSRKAGITEITPSQIQSPAVTSRLDILLQYPSSIRSEIKDNALLLYVEDQGAALRGTVPLETKSNEEGEDAKEIVAVLLDKTDEGVELIIKGDGIMPEPAVFELDGRVMIDIPNVLMKASLPSNMIYPVKDIKYKAEKEKVRFIVGSAGNVDTEVFAMEDEIVVGISLKQKSATETQQPKLKTHNSKVVSLDFQDADIVPILRLIGEVGGYNIVVHPEVKGTITMKLLNVPWEQALDIVLKTFSLEKIVEGNVIRVVTRKVFEEELKAAMAVEAAKEVFGKAEDIETKIFALSYADADKIRALIEKAKILSPSGSVSIDARTRSLIVKDISSSIDGIKRLMETLDKPTPQVLIEARIVEMNTNFARDIGVQWGLRWTPKMGDQNTNIVGSASNSPTGGRSPGLINLPVGTSPIPSGATSAITVGYLNAAQTFGLDLRLSAAETVGKAKLISSPKIMTIENEKAEIIHGTQIPVITPGAGDNPPTVTYKDANLKLIVTPSVTHGDTVFLSVEITNDLPDFRPERAILGNVPIDKREAKNKVLVKNGETIVIGGILKTREDEGEDRVPRLHKIPILGWLFKRELKKTESQELLIFITPRIVR